MTRQRQSRQADDGLEAFFAAARDTAPEPSIDFLAQVLGDAEAVQDRLRTLAPARRPAPHRDSLLRRLLQRLDLFGTHGLVGGGLVTAAIVGFGIGFSGSLNGAAWMGQVAPGLFSVDSDTAMVLLPESDSFVIALSDAEGGAP